MPKDTEILYDTEHGARWFPLCRKPGCPHTQYRRSGYCYPHSKWWRRWFMVYINRLVSKLEDLREGNSDG